MRCAALFGTLLVVLALSEARSFNNGRQRMLQDRLKTLGSSRLRSYLQKTHLTAHQRNQGQETGSESIDSEGDAPAVLNAVMFAGECFTDERFWEHIGAEGLAKDEYPGTDKVGEMCFYAIKKLQDYVETKDPAIAQLFHKHSRDFTCGNLKEMEMEVFMSSLMLPDEEARGHALIFVVLTWLYTHELCAQNEMQPHPDKKDINNELTEKLSRFLTSKGITRRSTIRDISNSEEGEDMPILPILEAFEFAYGCIIESDRIEKDEHCMPTLEALWNMMLGDESESYEAAKSIQKGSAWYKCGALADIGGRLENAEEGSMVKAAVEKHQDFLNLIAEEIYDNNCESESGDEGESNSGSGDDVKRSELLKLLLKAISKKKK